MAQLEIDGTEYYYRVSKRALDKEPAVVCLHGSGADGVVWSYQVSRLSRFYRVIVPDLPGHGKSGGRPLASTADYALWLDRVAAALEVSALFIMGHSLGGAIAQEYARLHPSKVLGLLLASTGAAFRISRAYNEIPGESDAGTKVKIAAEYQQAYEMLLQSSDDTLFADLPAAAGFDSREWISTLRIPALVLCGSEDIITPREMSEELARGLPESEMKVIPGGGHVLMLDAIDAFNEAVKEFIDRVFMKGGKTVRQES